MESIPDTIEEGFCREILESSATALAEELSLLERRAGEDSIHDTRVVSRRMRAVLEAFKDLFPPRPWRSLYNRTREVTVALGKVRESEVNLALLKDLTASGDMAENICREYLQERFQARLRKRLRRLKKKLRNLDGDRIRAQADFLLAGLGTGGESGGTGPASDSRPRRAALAQQQLIQPTLFELRPTPGARAGRILTELSGPIVQFRPRYEFRHATDERLHELRVAAKKLRYAMEIFDPFWPGGLKKEIALARSLQDAGGTYHDWCILRARIQAEIRRLTGQETTHLAFQMGRLLAQVEDRRLELRKKLTPSITRLRAAFLRLFPDAAPAVSRKKRARVVAEAHGGQVVRNQGQRG
jgi:CHAD domain-containing protein